ncbi:MAG TPA: hypothetical protein PKI41_03600 [Candidatus Competibacteraceae bacterium]|nr:hypothetical protein [Candidatus Competibacteraceae bacterium]HQA24738.1 hypothetical protein [Candidatus Competibacteraceae bacterium]HQD55508.1 hypothetical protein [Candidatus Competibacteraceae bacterium]
MSLHTLATQIVHAVGHPKLPTRLPKIKPSQYALGYHSLLISDQQQKLFTSVNITRYQNGTRSECEAERSTLLTAIAKILGVKHLQAAFNFPQSDVMDSTKTFYKPGINRAYRGKGSPSEIADVIRLAVRCERIGIGKVAPSADQYAKQFLGLDCNGLVGNYHNLSPAISVGVWAQGEPGKLMAWSEHKQLKSGWGAAELATAPYIPLQPRRAIAELCDGDVLVTVTSDHHYKHIALVEDIAAIDKDQVSWKIVEWGEGGNADKHIKPSRTVKLEQGKIKKYGLGFASKGNFRYLFANPNTPWEPAKWGRCGALGI